MGMRTVSYEVVEGPQTITVIQDGPESPNTKCTSSQYDKNQRRTVKTYTVPEKYHRGPTIQQYTYDEQNDRQVVLRSQQDQEVTVQSSLLSPSAVEDRSIKIVSRSSSPVRESNQPRSILKTTTKSVVESKADATAAISTMSVVGTTKEVSLDTTYSSLGRTSSRTGIFYFAYGTHLDPHNIADHLPYASRSLQPVAIAKLHNYTWYINSNGIPNLAPCPYSSQSPSSTSSPATTVHGVLYNIPSPSESTLDTLHSYCFDRTESQPNPLASPYPTKVRPYLQQFTNLTNKLYHHVEIISWFSDPKQFGLLDALYPGDRVRAMIYIDEINISPGRIMESTRMEMSEAVTKAIKKYGVDKVWVRDVMGMYGIRILQSHDDNERRKVYVKEEWTWKKNERGRGGRSYGDDSRERSREKVLRLGWYNDADDDDEVSSKSSLSFRSSKDVSRSQSRSRSRRRTIEDHDEESSDDDDKVVVEERVDIHRVSSDFY